jgi:hypothetical protein
VNYPVLRGDKRRKSLDQIQDRIATLQADRNRVATAPVDNNTLLARTQSQLETGSGLQGAVSHLSTQTGQHGALGWAAPVTLGDLAWILGPRELALRIVQARQRQERGETTEGIAPQDCVARVTALDAELFDLQKTEEREVLKLLSEQLQIIRRENADPAAVLAVWRGEK